MAEGLTGGCGDFGDGSGCVYMCNWLEKHLFYEGLMSWIEILFFFCLLEDDQKGNSSYELSEISLTLNCITLLKLFRGIYKGSSRSYTV